MADDRGTIWDTEAEQEGSPGLWDNWPVSVYYAGQEATRRPTDQEQGREEGCREDSILGSRKF